MARFNRFVSIPALLVLLLVSTAVTQPAPKVAAIEVKGMVCSA